ncbi:MAG: STAS/SEC14 domain-containing protein [Crocinitomicaceae bacterium]|nr:STAS/SEC14 domain-containing protein [Crocinitomicaceae bacterium]
MVEDVIEVVERVDFKKSTYEFQSDGIVVITIKDDVHLEIEDALEEFRVLLQKQSYHPVKALIIPGENASVSKEVRDFANSAEGKSIMKCQAIVVESLAHRIMANFMKRFYKTPVTIKIFNDKYEALDWLQSVR